MQEFITILSYDNVLAASEIEKQDVNQEALQNRKKFLSNVVTQSLEIQDNIMKNPLTSEFKTIGRKSKIQAVLYRIFVLALLKSGLANSQLKRVYTSVN